VNGQSGVKNSKYVVVMDPLFTGHVIQRIAVNYIAFNTGLNAIFVNNLVYWFTAK